MAKKFRAGDMVRVVHPISRTEAELEGRVFRFVRYATHGYAVVGDEHGFWQVHHEVLTLCDTSA